MTSAQEAHLKAIKQAFLKEVDKKYRQGQKEHGGDLWKKRGVIQMLKDEAIDIWVYALTLEQQMRHQKISLGTTQDQTKTPKPRGKK